MGEDSGGHLGAKAAQPGEVQVGPRDGGRPRAWLVAESAARGRLLAPAKGQHGEREKTEAAHL
jgi:hypothetical protein